MKLPLKRAARGLLALAAFLYLSGCSPKAAQLKDPSALAGRLDLKVSPEEKQAFEAELKAGAKGEQAARALYFLGLFEYQEGRPAEAGKLFQRLEAEQRLSPWAGPAVFMMGASLERLNDLPRAFVQYQRLVQASGELASRSQKACERILDAPLSEAQLKSLIQHPALPQFQSALRLKLIRLLVESAAALPPLSATARVDEAFLAIEEFHRLYPGSPQAAELDALAREADKAVPVDKKSLGLLLPLGGPQAAVGLQLRQGAELALEELNAGLPEGSKIVLKLGDEGGDSEAAVASARKLIIEEQVIGILGPMSSDASQAVLPLAAARRTPLLSPYAVRPDLAAASPYFFRNCMTLEKQAVAMADHALLELKLTRVAALYPDTSYGAALAGAFSGRMAELGAPLLSSLSYTAGQADFKDMVVSLGGVNPTALKEADTQEKREQQARVESASTVLGKALLSLKAELESRALSPVAAASADTLVAQSYRPLSFPARVAVFDFACSTSAAFYNAGRSFSDRFGRVLGQLDELRVLQPEEGLKRLRERALTPEQLNAPLAAELGRAMNADFVLWGMVNELSPDWAYLNEAAKGSGREARQAKADIELFSKSQVFQVTAQVLDARSASVVASAHFEAPKLRPPQPNPLGLQALYLPCRASEAVQAASALSFCDLKVQLLGSDLWKAPELLQSDNAAALEGARLTVGFFLDGSDPSTRRFAEAYKKKYAALPSAIAAQAYDAALILGGALKDGASTREELRQAMLKLHNFEGASGRTSFDGRQDAIKKVGILRVNSVTKTFEEVQR